MLGRSVAGGPDLSEMWRLIASLVGVLGFVRVGHVLQKAAISVHELNRPVGFSFGCPYSL